MDRLEARHQLVFALLVRVLSFQQDLGLIAQAVHCCGIVVQRTQCGLQCRDLRSSVGDPARQGGPIGLDLAGGRPVPLSFGGDPFPEVVPAITGRVTTSGLVERAAE